MFTTQELSSSKSILDQVLDFKSIPIPNIFFKNWIGLEFPNTKEKPYLQWLAEDKKMLPVDWEVQGWVVRSLLKASGNWDYVVEFFKQNHLVLKVIEDEKNLLNHDRIMELIQCREYVQASDLLRPAVIHAQGGWYLDADIRLTKALPKDQSGFLFTTPTGAKIDKDSILQYCFMAGSKNHPFFLYTSVIARFFQCSLKNLQSEIGGPPSWMTSRCRRLRRQFILFFSGECTTNLIMRSSLVNVLTDGALNYIFPFDEFCKMKNDPSSWLDEFPNACSSPEELEQCFVFYRKLTSQLNDDFLNKKARHYFPFASQVLYPLKDTPTPMIDSGLKVITVCKGFRACPVDHQDSIKLTNSALKNFSGKIKMGSFFPIDFVSQLEYRLKKIIEQCEELLEKSISIDEKMKEMKVILNSITSLLQEANKNEDSYNLGTLVNQLKKAKNEVEHWINWMELQPTLLSETMSELNDRRDVSVCLVEFFCLQFNLCRQLPNQCINNASIEYVAIPIAHQIKLPLEILQFYKKIIQSDPQFLELGVNVTYSRVFDVPRGTKLLDVIEKIENGLNNLLNNMCNKPMICPTP